MPYLYFCLIISLFITLSTQQCVGEDLDQDLLETGHTERTAHHTGESRGVRSADQKELDEEKLLSLDNNEAKFPTPKKKELEEKFFSFENRFFPHGSSGLKKEEEGKNKKVRAPSKSIYDAKKLKIKRKKIHEPVKTEEQPFNTQDLSGIYHDPLTPEDILNILEEEFSHLSGLFDEQEDDHGDTHFHFTGNIEVSKDPNNPLVHTYLIKNKKNQLILVFKEADDLLTLWASIQNKEPLNKIAMPLFKYADTLGEDHYLYAFEVQEYE